MIPEIGGVNYADKIGTVDSATSLDGFRHNFDPKRRNEMRPYEGKYKDGKPEIVGDFILCHSVNGDGRPVMMSRSGIEGVYQTDNYVRVEFGRYEGDSYAVSDSLEDVISAVLGVTGWKD